MNLFDFFGRDKISSPPWERNFGRVEPTEGSEPEVTGNPMKRSKMPIAISYGEKYYEHF